MKNLPLFEVKNIKKYFYKGEQLLKAVNDVSFEIFQGETLGLVGESGCGKSTLGRILLRVYEPSSGEIFFDQKNLLTLNKTQLKQFRKETGFIFQDPYASLNPRMTAAEIVGEPLEIHRICKGKEREERIRELLHLVGLNDNALSRFPHEFSGGQRQRIGIARAISANPRFVICDEAISALDVSVQAQIINLLKKLQNEMGLTFLFIAHDLRVVKYLSNRVAVMYLGHIVELADSVSLYQTPLHPYTEALLSAIPIPDPKVEQKRTRIVLKGEVPSPLNPPKGCVFSTRCPKAMAICSQIAPSWKEVKKDHFAACHLL
ncbi:MAG TPA: oligopeptide/dipeptide ABC transporter ATP-binding protein [Rhabdochlamydiaceae bacterium]|nr:oligopeptide/dipeptide ABC transporter ATP-binding protein [Rhabdochlamydiaceae bacterium]